MNIYEDTPGSVAILDTAQIYKADPYKPKEEKITLGSLKGQALAEGSIRALVGTEDNSSLYESMRAGFKDAYERIGWGSYQTPEGYSELYNKLLENNVSLPQGISEDGNVRYSNNPAYIAKLLKKNKDFVDKVVKERPDLGLKSIDQIEKESLYKLQQEAKENEEVLKRSSGLGKVSGVLGTMFGALTDPVTAALAVVTPTGLAAPSVSAKVLPQVPRIWAWATAGAGASSAITKGRDLEYRQNVLGEDITKANVPAEIASEAAIGGLAGTALIAGGAALARGMFNKAGSRVIEEVSEGTASPTRLAEGPQEPAWVAEYRQKELESGSPGAIDRDNPYTPEMRKNYEELQAAKDNGANLTIEEEDNLYKHQEINELLDTKPPGVSQKEYLASYADARADLETPKYEAEFPEVKENEYIDVTPEEKDAIISDYVRWAEEHPHDLTTEEGQAMSDFFKEYSEEISSMSKLEQCLTAVKPRIN